MIIPKFDQGSDFDFGRVADEYAKYRDIYPESFYNKILSYNVGVKGQSALDLGTGSGVIPRHMHCHGADWTAADVSPLQIDAAKRLSKAQNMNIKYLVCPADAIPVPDKAFDAITAIQCFWYFPTDTAVPEIRRVLKKNGTFVIAYMAGIPGESAILAKSEELVLKYNPNWSSGGFKRIPLPIPNWLDVGFELLDLHDYMEDIPFTIETWRGRMRTLRGIGAALTPELVTQFDEEHERMLTDMTNGPFTIPHHCKFVTVRKI
jgi:SAM-dependent methyltransferase